MAVEGVGAGELVGRVAASLSCLPQVVALRFAGQGEGLVLAQVSSCVDGLVVGVEAGCALAGRGVWLGEPRLGEPAQLTPSHPETTTSSGKMVVGQKHTLAPTSSRRIARPANR